MLRAAPLPTKKTGLQIIAEEDPKEFFHYHPYTLTRIIAMHREYGWGPVPPEVEALDKKFGIIHTLAREAVSSTYKLLEETHPEMTSRLARKEDLFGSPLRLLFYHPGQGDHLAGGHTDKGLGTIQIAESHMGFRYRMPADNTEEAIAGYRDDPLNDERMQLLRRGSDDGVFFAAEALRNPDAFPDTNLQPLWHDVINVDDLNEGRTLHGQKCARWALIFFTNSLAAGHVSKARTHTEVATA